jgi:hypothetical protein
MSGHERLAINGCARMVTANGWLQMTGPTAAGLAAVSVTAMRAKANRGQLRPNVGSSIVADIGQPWPHRGCGLVRFAMSVRGWPRRPI